MIFIIGASGLIGGNILNYLKKKGYKVSGTYFKTKKKGGRGHSSMVPSDSQVHALTHGLQSY